MNTQEQEICTAPPGKLRIVYEDARDHWPSKQKDVEGFDEARAFLASVDSTSYPCMVVYNEKCERVVL